MRMCDDTWWYMSLMHIYAQSRIGFNVCQAGIYEYMTNNNAITCAKEYYDLYDLIDSSVGGEKFGNLGINTCDKSRPSWVKIDQPGGPLEDKKDTEWADIIIVKNPNAEI